MPKEQFDYTNFDHIYFHGSQEGLDKANARKVVLDLLQEKTITKEEKEEMFNRIGNSENDIIEALLSNNK